MAVVELGPLTATQRPGLTTSRDIPELTVILEARW
jgi:hypothetical protein